MRFTEYYLISVTWYFGGDQDRAVSFHLVGRIRWQVNLPAFPHLYPEHTLQFRAFVLQLGSEMCVECPGCQE